MRKKNNFAEELQNIASEIIDVLYRIFKGIFVLIPIFWEKVKRLFHFSISFKISIVYSLLFFFSLMMFSFLIMGFFAITVGKDTVENMDISINELDKYIKERSLEKLADSDNLVTLNGKYYLYVYDTNQTLIFKNLESAPLMDLEIPEKNFKFNSVFLDEKILLTQVKESSDRNQSFYILTAFDVKPILKYIAVLAGFLFLISLVFFVLLPALGFRLSKNMLLPIKKMTQDAKEISLLNLDKRLDVSKSQDELKDLSLTFNEMLDRLQNSYEKQYQFISDASHELRTPISVIQGYANLLTRWGKDDKKILDESVEAIKNEAESMKDLIEKLLFIARSESKHQNIEKSMFNVNELLNEIVKEYKVFDTSHIFQVDADPTLSLNADRKLIKQLIRIFMDNSVKYTQDNGTISLSSNEEKNKLFFIIKDNGIGINEKDLPKIFDRFYRADTSRDKKSGGSGLGLSIAKVIMDLHDAKVKVFSKPGEGTEIQIIFHQS